MKKGLGVDGGISRHRLEIGVWGYPPLAILAKQKVAFYLAKSKVLVCGE